jgi:lipid A ethanolaminephosphotransferase
MMSIAQTFGGLVRPSQAGVPGRRTWHAQPEWVLLAMSGWWTLTANYRFFTESLQGRGWQEPGAWGFGLALGVGITALQALLLALVAHRTVVKPLLAVLAVVAALATYYGNRFGVYFDPSMLRNVLRTQPAEARELITWAMAPYVLLQAGVPLWLLSRWQVPQRQWAPALGYRLGALALAAAALIAAMMLSFQPLSSTMRNHKELRYLITPASVAWSTLSTLRADARGAVVARVPIGLDAAKGPTWAARKRPLLTVLVVGETARAANWGLSGYERNTTPELAQRGVINFADVTSCGTSTEVSLPCMFAPLGRRDYNEDRIRGSESLLHVIARTGIGMTWRDNQTGCKGVCDGLPTERVEATAAPALCDRGHCFDEALLDGLDARLDQLTKSGAGAGQVLVLHMLGNHGPSYFRRYPTAFSRFEPACGSDDLQQCSQQEIVNAFDNALLYTDHVLAMLIDRLAAASDRVDASLVYVSDHGESLGEAGLFLHGVPYIVAPKVQTQVPMVMWFSSGFAQAGGLDVNCMRERAAAPASHDDLFHTLLGLTDVSTAIYEPALDISATCRHPPAGGAAAAAAGAAVAVTKP